MDIDPQFISLKTKAWAHIHRNGPDHYIATIDIDILYGDEREKIGEAKAFEVRMDHIVNDGGWSLVTVFDGYSGDLSELYEELFPDDELIPAVKDELGDYDNIVLIKLIVLKPEYRGQGLGGILALAIAERFDDRDIVALKPWPMNPDGPENPCGVWELPRLKKARPEGNQRREYGSSQAVHTVLKGASVAVLNGRGSKFSFAWSGRSTPPKSGISSISYKRNWWRPKLNLSKDI